MKQHLSIYVALASLLALNACGSEPAEAEHHATEFERGNTSARQDAGGLGGLGVDEDNGVADQPSQRPRRRRAAGNGPSWWDAGSARTPILSAYQNIQVAADFDDDGQLDIIRPVGPLRERTTSQAYPLKFLFGGKASGSSTVAVSPGQVAPAAEGYVIEGRFGRNELIGSSIATGDFDGDLKVDVAIGDPTCASQQCSRDSGVVLVVYGHELDAWYNQGGKPGPRPTVHVLEQGAAFNGSTDLGGAPEPGDQFGFSVASGDFNCDGADDLAIGTPYEDYGDSRDYRDAGQVQVLLGRRTGSARGLTTDGSRPFGQYYRSIRGNAETGDLFGFSLTELPGPRGCDSLVVGVPGERVESHRPAVGALNVFYSSSPTSWLRTSDDALLYEGRGIDDSRESYDRIGVALGYVERRFGGADLWIGGTEDQCGAADERTFFFKSTNLKGKLVGSTSYRCGYNRPDLLRRERGWVVEKAGVRGRHHQYVPQSFNSSHSANPGLLALIQGTPALPSCAPGDSVCFSQGILEPTWRDAGNWLSGSRSWSEFRHLADAQNQISIAPVMDHRYYSQSGWLGSYRGLFGHMPPEAWLHEIVDSYQEVGVFTNSLTPAGGNKLRIYGHSAGGQFVARYAMAHPERLVRGVIGSAGRYMWDWGQSPQSLGGESAGVFPAEWNQTAVPRGMQFTLHSPRSRFNVWKTVAVTLSPKYPGSPSSRGFRETSMCSLGKTKPGAILEQSTMSTRARCG